MGFDNKKEILMKVKSLILINMIWLLFPLSGRAAMDPDWNCDIHAYEYDMSVYLSLRQEGKPYAGDLLMAAFVGDECRGIAELQSLEEISYYYVRVRSDEASGDSVYFKVYDRGVNKELRALGSIMFENLAQVGYPSQPWVLVLPVVTDPDALENVDETTKELCLAGTWSEDAMKRLAERLHPEGQINENLSSVDMSEAELGEDVTMEGVFTNNEALTSVILPDLSDMNNLSGKAFEGTNPNCVVFLKEKIDSQKEWNADVNIIVGTQASELKLKEHHPFHIPEEITVDRVVYERAFGMGRSLRSVAANGWETICLPFAATEVKIGEKDLRPVSVAEGVAAGDFYVATWSDKGFEEVLDRETGAPYLEANIPYLINMVSPEGYRIEGTVAFVADKEKAGAPIVIKATEASYRQESSRYDWIGVFGKVAKTNGVYVINTEGTAFDNDSRDVLPFECYLYSASASEPSISITMYVAVTGVQLYPETASIGVGETLALSATVLPEDATNKNLRWSSSDASVASVDATGVVLGKKKGDVIISVKTEDGGFEASSDLSVSVVTGVESIDSPSVRIYPTIVSSHLEISGLAAGGQIEVISYLGQIVKTVKTGSSRISIDMSDLRSGYYLVRIRQCDESQVFKVMKK